MIATEAYLVALAGSERDSILRFAERVINGDTSSKPLLPETAGAKISIANAPGITNQFYSSTLVNAVRNGNRALGVVDVRSGRHANGRDMRQAKMFGHIGNVAPPPGGGNNAFFANGTSVDMFQNIKINGKSTIMGDLNVDRDVTLADEAWIGGNFEQHGDRPFNTQDYYLGGTSNRPLPPNDRPLDADPTNRLELPIDINNIPNGVGHTYNRGNTFNSVAGAPAGPKRYKINENDTHFDVNDLRNVYNHAKDNGNLYNGHVVVEINNGDASAFNLTNGGEFNDSVIFIVNTTWNNGGKFYKSGPNASTMIYVAPERYDPTHPAAVHPVWGYPPEKRGWVSPKLHQFGLSDGGTFRGLIYVDPENDLDQNFHWGGNSVIEGAVLMMGKGNVRWESGGSLELNYNSAALSRFPPRIGGSTDPTTLPSGSVTVTLPDNQRIDFQAFGYYFY